MSRARRSMPHGALVLASVALAAVVALLVTRLETRASLEEDALGWTQPRHDVMRTGLSASAVGPTLRLIWSRALGSALSGEVAVDAERLVVVADDGVVHSLDHATGETAWRTGATPGWPTGPQPSRAALVESEVGAGVVAVGRRPSGDALLAAGLRDVIVAIESYSIDWNEYPPGPDLDALSPTYIRSLPENPHSDRPMEHSDVPSPGDLRYERVAPDTYHLGAWGSDDALLEPRDACGPGPGWLGLADDWPVSTESGGRPTWLAAVDGSELRADSASLPALSVSPAALADGSVGWSRAMLSAAGPGWPHDRRARRELADHGVVSTEWQAPLGAVSREDASGSVAWMHRFGAPVRGGAAHDSGAGSLIVALGPSRLGDAWIRQAREISTGLESWAIDEERYPATGEVRDLLVPAHVRCWPSSVLDGEPLRWSDVPLPGHYHYVSEPPHHDYVLSIWGERDEPAITMDTGSFTDWEPDEPPSVAAVDGASGDVLWRTWIGEPTQDVTPVMLVPDPVAPTSVLASVIGTSGGLVVALDPSDGSELWRHDGGRVFSLAPALLPDGGIVLVADSGHVVVVEPDGRERWRLWLGAAVTAAPATTGAGVVLVGDVTGTLHVLAADGRLVAARSLGGPERAALTTTPVAAAGRVVVGRADGVLLALGPLDPVATPAPPIPSPAPPTPRTRLLRTP